jgi:hypothetical protein
MQALLFLSNHDAFHSIRFPITDGMVFGHMKFIRNRSASLSMVVLVLFIIGFLQGSISYSISFGKLNNILPWMNQGMLPVLAFLVRGSLLLMVLVLWILNRKQILFKVIILTNSVFTLGLLLNMATLLDILRGVVYQKVETLLLDVILLAIANILLFSIWYWLIDPPGVDGSVRDDEPWDFLFPQRSQAIPNYESWVPRYTDYIYLAFTTSFAFSPTDTLPLTRRAKMFMLLQSTISIVTLTAIAGAAINILAGGS